MFAKAMDHFDKGESQKVYNKFLATPFHKRCIISFWPHLFIKGVL